jgi:hypothetical protein
MWLKNASPMMFQKLIFGSVKRAGTKLESPVKIFDGCEDG